jgi:trimeric autotransporter adhesin
MLVFRIPSDPKSKDSGQPLLYPVNRRYLIPDLRMLKPSSLHPRLAVPVCLLLPLLFLAFAAWSPLAFGQDFSMMVTSPYPSAVNPGQDSRSYITLSPLNGFSGSVSLSCTVAPIVANGPTCTPPTTATPPVQLAMSITVASDVPSGFYALTVTATDATPTTQTATIYLTVLPVGANDYTLAVTSPIFPTSVHAGYTASATVTVTPLNGYQGTVTLSCASIAPLATPAPSCAFVPPAVSPAANGIQPPYTSLLTITTTGPTNTPLPGTASLPWTISKIGALWMTFPGMGLMLAGLAGPKRRRRKLWPLSLLWLAAAAMLLMPACSTTNSNTGLNGNTPKNTYVFTLTGADTSGVAPSNEATPPTISLTVN